MAYEYVRQRYCVKPEVGATVKHKETGKSGTIARENRSQAHYVMVKFDGQKFAMPCHPDALEYQH